MSRAAEPRKPPTDRQRRRWRRYLADERAEAALYRELAQRKRGEEREILLGLAEAEQRHASHWVDLLGEDAGPPARASWRSRMLIALARRLGSLFVLVLAQRAEGRSPYARDRDATEAMAADERIHGEVLRGLAARGRLRLAGSFRAAVFGINDGLVSNFALVLGVAAAGLPAQTVLITGVAGLVAGSLSMAAGEYVSVSSQRELLEASRPDPRARRVVSDLDVDANELALVYRARGMSAEDAARHAEEVLASRHLDDAGGTALSADAHDGVGTPWGAAISSFVFFAIGAILPVLPYAFGGDGFVAVAIATAAVGVGLLATGWFVGLLSGGSLLKRAIRQLAIGLGAAVVTYLVGLAFGTTVR